MAGITGFRRAQIGLESTAGTAVAATAILRGPAGAMKNDSVLVFPPEDVGYVSGVDRAYIPQLGASYDMPAMEATFEQLPYICAAGIKNVTTGASDGAGTDKVYAYPFPTTSLNTISTYTVETGNDNQEEEMEYAFVDSFTLEGSGGGSLNALMVSAKWIGRQVTPSSFTSLVAYPSVEEILFGKGKLYIDAIGGTIGTTQKTGTFLGMSLKVKTGWVPRYTGDGQKYFYRPAFVKEAMEVLCDITFEHDATAVATRAAAVGPTAQKVRLQFDGSSVGTPGTTYSTKALRIDLAGLWEMSPPLESQNGNDILKMTMRARRSSTASLFAVINVVNELTALT